MECDDIALLMAWIAKWRDLVDFEVVPVATSDVTKAVVQASAKPKS